MSYIFLFFSSNLTESTYLLSLITVVLTAWVIFILIFHFCQFKISGLILLFLFSSATIFMCIRIYRTPSGYIESKRTYLVVYKGVPIPYFDMMIFPNGRFRLVDKKLDFNNLDKKIIFAKNPDILLIGTGKKGKSGSGLGADKEVQFIYNNQYKRAVQLIKLKTPEACRNFNRLKKSGYNVMFIINNN